jgi:hypothetical protein
LERSETLTIRRARLLIGVLAVLSLPAFLASRIGPAASALVRQVDTANAYLSWVDPALLYLGVPLSVAGAVVLVMSPGLLGALALGRGRNLWAWLLEGFVLSLVSISVAAAAVQAWIARELTGAPFVLLVLLLAGVSAVLLYIRVARGAAVPWPLASPRSRLVLATCIAVPLVFLVALMPKFFWESFNGDGAHTFETARLLLHQPLPFWPPSAGAISLWPGVNGLTVQYVPSWFVRLFGETEAGVRIPLVMYLPMLFAAVAAVAEVGRREVLRPAAVAFIWGGVLSFALVMSYSATYDPYAADIALPAVQDAMVMIFFLGAVVAFIERDRLWLVVWTFLTLFTSPGSVPLLGLFLLAWFVSARPLPWRRSIIYGLGLIACLLIIGLIPSVLGILGVEMEGSEHSPVTLFLRQFEYMAVADFQRLAWLVLPTGIYTALGLFGWRGWDTLSRALTVLTVTLFGMYYVMATVSLHYFVPVMLLPLVIFWRKYGSGLLSPVQLSACGAGLAISLWFALPSGTGIYTATRTIGETIDVSSIEGYADMDPFAFRASSRLSALFPGDGRPEVPDDAYGGSPIAWMYYANRPEADRAPKNYVLAPADSELPPGAIEVRRDSVAAVYVYDADQWESDRRLKPQHSRGKAIYAVPRNVLLFRGADSERPGYFRARSWVGRLLKRLR